MGKTRLVLLAALAALLALSLAVWATPPEEDMNQKQRTDDLYSAGYRARFGLPEGNEDAQVKTLAERRAREAKRKDVGAAEVRRLEATWRSVGLF